MSACEKCAEALRRVVFTTAGEGDQQVALWREYPLAVDGWLCTQCGWSAVPRRMSTQEVTDCIQTGVQHAQKGATDDAEYWFRRAACSWPDYSPGLANLAELLTARAAAAGRDVAERHALRAAAERYLRRALEKDPTNLPASQLLTLARLEAFAGREDDALRRLEELARRTELPASVRGDVEALRARQQPYSCPRAGSVAFVGNRTKNACSRHHGSLRRRALAIQWRLRIGGCLEKSASALVSTGQRSKRCGAVLNVTRTRSKAAEST